MAPRSSASPSASRSLYVVKEAQTKRVLKRDIGANPWARNAPPPSKASSTGEFETGDDSFGRHDGETDDIQFLIGDEESRKKLEVVSGLLGEGYGIGVVLTAGVIRGVTIAGDVFKNVAQTGTAAARKWRVTRQPKNHTQQQHKSQSPTIMEKLQQSVSENLTATSITWKPSSDPQISSELEKPAKGTERIQTAQTMVLSADAEPGRESEEEEDLWTTDFKQQLGIPENEPLSSSHITGEPLGPAAFLGAGRKGTTIKGLAEELSNDPEDENVEAPLPEESDAVFAIEDITMDQDLVAEVGSSLETTEEVPHIDEEEETADKEVFDVVERELETEKNNIESFPNLETQCQEHREDQQLEETSDLEIESSVVLNRAKQILDEISNFEIESGGSFEAIEGETLPAVEFPYSDDTVVPVSFIEESSDRIDVEDDVDVDLEEQSDIPKLEPSNDTIESGRLEMEVYETEDVNARVPEQIPAPETKLPKDWRDDVPSSLAKIEIEDFAVTEPEVAPEPVEQKDLVLSETSSLPGSENKDASSPVEEYLYVGPGSEATVADISETVEEKEAAERRTRAEIEEELKREMRIESEKRLRAMKLQNEQRYQHTSTVKVERVSPDPESSPPQRHVREEMKGLDFIKSYAKESQETQTVGHEEKEESGIGISSFFTPPSFVPDGRVDRNLPRAAASSSRGYSQWKEVDRLKRVREIGTVLWLGRGGNGGGNGGNGGGGGGSGGGDRFGDNSEDKNWWWVQVGVSMATMTALVFALLTALTNQLEKKKLQKEENQEEAAH